MPKKYKIVVVGAGGTGGILIQNLAHFVYGRIEPEVRIIVVDGDVVELNNVGRQKYTVDDLGKNKAQCIAVRYSDVFGLDIGYIPEYIRTTEALLDLVTPDEPRELSVLVMAVDNNFSRQLAHRVFYDERIDDIIYIDTGNENGRGQTVAGIKWDGKIVQEPCGKLFPDILESDDYIKEGRSCGQIVVQRPQTLLENVWSGTVAFSYLVHLINNGEIPKHYTFFDTATIQARSVENKPAHV